MKFDKYRLIIFDMDGTLYQFEGSGGDNAIFKTKFYDEVKQNVITFLEERLSVPNEEALMIRNEVFKKYKGDLSIGFEKEYRINRGDYFNNVWNIDAGNYIKENPELRDLIKSIKCKKTILTMAPKVWTENVLNHLNIIDLFDGIWFGEGDIRKPNKEAYLQITDSFSINPEETLIVEDEPKYLKPAKELGMTTVLIGSNKENYIDYNIKDVFKIKKLVSGE